MIAPVRKAAVIAAIKSKACNEQSRAALRWLLRQRSVRDAWAVLERRETGLRCEWRCWVLHALGLHRDRLMKSDRFVICNDGSRRVPWSVVRAAMREWWGV